MDIRWLSGDELYKIFSADESLWQEYSDGKYKYLNFDFGNIRNDECVVAFIEGKIAGIGQVGLATTKDNTYWMKFVTVHPDFRRQGVSEALLRGICSYLLTKGDDAKLDLSSYSEDGEVLSGLVSRIAQDFPELLIRHRAWGGVYQDARNPFFKLGEDVVITQDSTLRLGIVVDIIEDSGSTKIIVRDSLDPEVVEVLTAKDISKKMG